MRHRATVAAVLLALSAGGLACGDSTDTTSDRPVVVEDAAARQEARDEARQERVAAQRQARREARRARVEARRARIRAERRAAHVARLRAERRAAREAARRAAEEAARAEAEAEASNCDPNYSGACLDPNAYDYDCAGGSGDGPEYTGAVQVVGSDPYGLDSDGDGYACE
jgi:hypothetical protein